jgi:DNA-binding MarR family transcriptional regulator
VPKPGWSSTPEVTPILDDLRRIVRVLRTASRQAEQRLGVTGAQLFVLKALDDEPRLSLTALALRTRTDQSTVSVVVKRLVARGLVDRVRAADDARRADLSLTRRGRTLLGTSPRAAQDGLITGLERLSAADRRALRKGLGALVVAMRLDDQPPVMFFEEEPSRKPKR